jgi:hypothetical protein
VSSILVILLIIAAVKFIFFGIVLFFVFRPELRNMGKRKAVSTTPTCVYCESRWTRAVDEGQTRWEDDDLVLVTTYECQHCSLPFWHVERVSMGSVKH